LDRFFVLDDADMELVAKRRGEHNRLGFSLVATTLRYVGLFLEDPLAVPWPVVEYLAEQLGIDDPSCVKRYTERQMTAYEHAQFLLFAVVGSQLAALAEPDVVVGLPVVSSEKNNGYLVTASGCWPLARKLTWPLTCISVVFSLETTGRPAWATSRSATSSATPTHPSTSPLATSRTCSSRAKLFGGEAVLSWESVPVGEAQIDDADQHRSAALDPACQHRPAGQPRS
jgi:hypothetical protein